MKARQSKNLKKSLKNSASKEQIERAKQIIKQIRILEGRQDFLKFVEYTKPDYQTNWHHRVLAEKLQKFAKGEIKKLMVFMPPQHGKSELTSRRLPAYLLGLMPKSKIVGCSYSADLARSFNRDVQRIIDSTEYKGIFPKTMLNGSNVKTSAKGSYLRNADIFETVGFSGFYKSVGVGGSLTGTAVDIGIIDDPVKDKVEAESPTYRARVWDWYINVFLTRLHNDSQQLITLTRWHKEDLAGRILSRMNKDNSWVVVSLPAIKESPTIPEDKRKPGQALWPEKHSLKKIMSIKIADPLAFSSLYQQDPEVSEELKIYPRWSTISVRDYLRVDIDPCYGVDFGYTNPSAIVELKIDEIRKRIYARQKVYKSGLTNAQLIEAANRAGVGRYKPMGADSNKPDAIAEMRPHFNVRKVSKGPGSVYNGIKKVKEYELIICEDSKDIMEEIKGYKWKEDADGNPLPEPVKKNDHGMDAIRYGVKNKQSKGQVLAFGGIG